jgi:hypothetical protein
MRNAATVRSLDGEVVAPVESEQLGKGDRVEFGEDDHVAFVGLGLPVQLDLERLDVGHAELAHLERRREDGTLKRAAAGNGLVRVQGGVGNLAEDL